MCELCGKSRQLTLLGVAQLVGASSCALNVTGLIPSQGTYWVVGLIPGYMGGNWLISLFLSSMFLSFFLSIPLPLFLSPSLKKIFFKDSLCHEMSSVPETTTFGVKLDFLHLPRSCFLKPFTSVRFWPWSQVTSLIVVCQLGSGCVFIFIHSHLCLCFSIMPLSPQLT